MREYITPHIIANWVRMGASERRGVGVVVEGDTDRRLFAGLLSTTYFYIAHSRETALGAAELLNDQEAQGVVVIVDADFDRILARSPSKPFVFWTDTHDAEGMCIQSDDVLRKLLREYGSVEKIQAATKRDDPTEQADAVRARLLALGALLGAARLWSLKASKSLSFQKITEDLEAWIARKGWTPDDKRLSNLLRSQNPKLKVTNDEIMQGMTQERAATPTELIADLCQGHDLAAILGLGLSQHLGSMKPKSEDIERLLRVAFSPIDFHKTRLCADLRRWEESDANARRHRLVRPLTA